jgi:hypothetical protein
MSKEKAFLIIVAISGIISFIQGAMYVLAPLLMYVDPADDGLGYSTGEIAHCLTIAH